VPFEFNILKENIIQSFNFPSIVIYTKIIIRTKVIIKKSLSVIEKPDIIMFTIIMYIQN
jgi:hypothetical protein